MSMGIKHLQHLQQSKQLGQGEKSAIALSDSQRQNLYKSHGLYDQNPKRLFKTPLFRAFFALCLSSIILLSYNNTIALADDMPDQLNKIITYEAYLNNHQGAGTPSEAITIKPSDFSDKHDSGAYIGTTHGRDDVLIWNSQIGRVDWQFSVSEAGLYELEFDYIALPGRQNEIEIGVAIDGEYPFENAKNAYMRRLFINKGPIERDARDNDIRPKLIEVEQWQTEKLKDNKNHYADPYLFYLTKGEHTLSIGLQAEAWGISEIRFVPKENIPTYAEYKAQFQGASDNTNHSSVTVQAENPGLRNSPVLYPVTERVNSATQPSDPIKVRMNTIGGNQWQSQGTWMEWEMTVPEDGWYHLTIRSIQTYMRGVDSVRRLYIDGKVPFEEANEIGFPYKSDWYMHTIGNEEGLLPIYLTKGSHIIKLEVASGPSSQALRRLEDVVTDLNTLYRRIIVLTGNNADGERITVDTNRDYHLEKKIPDLNDMLVSLSNTLKEQEAYIASFAGEGSEAAILLNVARQLDSFYAYPETIVSRLEDFKGNISNLASWVLQMRDQPLQIDYLTLTSTDMPLPTGTVGFFEQVAFRWRAFIGSFTEDYTAMGDIYDTTEEAKVITVWVCANDLGATGISSGRDQTVIIKELIDQLFVPETGIGVNLSLIDGSSTLMQAILGGKGPDVAITVYKELPVNLAMRGALLELSQFDEFQEITESFYDSAFIPYKYNGGVYALPETQNFDMIFYRKDIFNELGLTVPNTWDEFRQIVPILQKAGMQVGIPAPTVTNNNTLGFQAQLFQKGLNFYTEDLSKTQFDQPEALEAFRTWTDLYTKYAMPVKYDFFSRFRTGIIPLAIENYTTANMLAAAAQELQGLWDIAPIPGTVREDGTIDRSEGATGTGAIIIATTEEADASFEFIKWWVSDETQAEFGLALESLMGPSARWPTANKNAFERMKWTNAQQEAMREQWQWVTDIPQLPGNYIINRNLAFAFRSVTYNNKNVREVLNSYNKIINKEIERKWKEFMEDGVIISGE